MSPEEFLRTLMAAMTQTYPVLSQQVADKVSNAPPKVYAVKREDGDGNTAIQQVTLPAIMAELTDAVKLSNVLKDEELDLIEDLIDEMRMARKAEDSGRRKRRRKRTG